MSDLKLRAYWSLPPALRSVVATVKGMRLRWWRYGPTSERLAAEALERDAWNSERWKAWQEERLAYVLHRAVRRVPYYREQWNERRRKGDRASWELLENWPVLEKPALRSHPHAFVSDDCDTRRMYLERTSGTTGMPLRLWWSRETVRRWYALIEARCRVWNGVSRKDRWALVGGQLVTPVTQRTPPFWVWNAAMCQLYMSCYHLAPEQIPYHLDALRRYRVRYLVGYPSALFELGQGALRRGWDERGIEVVITTSEPLYEHQRDVIARAFGCPVRETYGMAEVVATSSECREGNLHLWPEAGILEVFRDDSPVPPGTTGDLVGTGLHNADMPLIRYRIGDRGAVPQRDAPCACGRGLPTHTPVEGRLDEVLVTSDGRPVGRLHAPVFKAELPVLEAQIIQETLQQLRICYVPAPGFTAATAEAIIERVRDRMGPVEVVLEQVNAVPRDQNGKFRAVISRVPREASHALGVAARAR